ncbi:hypothetical protein ACLOJK_021783 [Asimina triloba]
MEAALVLIVFVYTQFIHSMGEEQQEQAVGRSAMGKGARIVKSCIFEAASAAMKSGRMMRTWMEVAPSLLLISKRSKSSNLPKLETIAEETSSDSAVEKDRVYVVEKNIYRPEIFTRDRIKSNYADS